MFTRGACYRAGLDFTTLTESGHIVGLEESAFTTNDTGGIHDGIYMNDGEDEANFVSTSPIRVEEIELQDSQCVMPSSAETSSSRRGSV